MESGPNYTLTAVQPGQSVTVPGRITSIIDGAINLADQIVRYYDYGLGYQFEIEPLGRFTLTSNWTYYGYYARRLFTSDAYTSTVGRDLPRYRGQSAITWQRGPWGANVGMNYIHRHGNIDLDHYEAQRYYTYSAGWSYAFRRHRLLGDTHIALGVENILDRDPPLYPSPVGYEQSLIARPGGRFVFVTLRRSL